MADESIPTKKKPDITVTASPLPTLMEQIIQGQEEILNQPGATPPQPPRQLSVGERLNLAFAGLDPQFRRDIVQPEVEKRRGFTESVRQFEREETERKQKALAGALPAAVAEQKQIDEAKEEAAQTERFRQSFAAIADDYVNVAGQVQDVSSILEQTGNASDTLRGRDLLRRAATVQQVLQNADAGQPVNDDVLKFAQSELKELQAAIAVATAGLAGQERQAQADANIRGRAGARIPPTVVKEAEIWASVRDTAQLVLGRRELEGDIGGPILGRSAFMNDLQAQEEAELSIITGAIGRALGGGAALTPFEKATLRGLYTQVTDTATQKKARMQALIDFSQRKLDGVQKQFGDMGYGIGNPDEAELLRQQGGVLIGASTDGFPRFQMPNGEVLEVSP